MSGSDSYVSVPEDVVNNVSAGWVAGRNLLDEQFTTQQTIVSNMYDKVTPALELLISLLDGNLLPDGWEDTLRDVVINPLTLIDKGASLNAPTLTLPDDWNVDIPILGVLKDAPAFDYEESNLTAPERPTYEMDYKEGSYESVIWEPLYNTIIDGLRNDGAIISEEVQTLILEQAQARQKTIRDTAYQQAMDGIGAEGFSLPGGAEAAVIGFITNKTIEEDSAINRDIAIKMAELTDINKRYIIDKASVLEQLVREYYNNKENRSLEAEKALTQFILSRYQADASVYLQSVEADKLKLEAAVQKVDVILKQNQLTLQTFIGQLDAVKSEVDLKASRNKSITDGFLGEVEGFKAQLQERGDYWKALTNEQRNVVLRDELVLKKAVEEVNTLLQGILADSNLKSTITKDLAAIVSQIMASALTSVHTGITHSTSRSESLSEQISNSASISSTHSFDETQT